jgi:hypothetical protein
VLNLNISEAVEFGLITISDKAEGIEETKRRLGTELVLKSLEGRGGGGLGGRGESRSGSKEGGNNGELHLGRWGGSDLQRNCER